MPNTFTLIASSTVGAGGASSIDFTSIPSTYTDLVLKVSGRSTNASQYVSLYPSFNGNASSFSWRGLYSINGTSAASSSGTGAGSGQISGSATGTSSTSNTFGTVDIYITNYAGSTNKSYSTDGASETNATASEIGLHANLWSNTSAITSISLTLSGGNFAQYSTAYLYGVKNA